MAMSMRQFYRRGDLVRVLPTSESRIFSVVIDWSVQVNGTDAPGWDRDRDGCWFPDFDHQAYLLPFFDVGDRPIDEVGSTEFARADLERLRAHLQWWRNVFEGKPDHWTVTEASVRGTETVKLERQKVLAVVDRTLEMIDAASACGGSIVFFGD